MNDVVLEFRNIRKVYPKNNHVHTACDNVSFKLHKGECLGIVGESGSGKSTIAKILMKLETLDSGEILFDGNDVSHIKGKELKKYFRDVQMVFQDAYGSFNPKMNIGSSLLEYICNLCFVKKSERKDIAVKLLKEVGLSEEHFYRYPSELSGGQCQRAAIARALSVHPKVIIFDEATSALDVSVQAVIIELLNKMKKERDLSYIFICHDLALVSSFCDRTAVINHGKLIEINDTYDVINNPQEEYTKMLLHSVVKI
ncbi:MAG: dipeptide/oligopeptide/nickel ABC transporter ATP-binding protein [Clostridium sp.]|nr:dipeptide/oligopeptide/nickel ABC transporter ATP-binding protein [Clostridium sp.]